MDRESGSFLWFEKQKSYSLIRQFDGLLGFPRHNLFPPKTKIVTKKTATTNIAISSLIKSFITIGIIITYYGK